MADGSVIIDVLVKLSEKDLAGLTSRLQKAGDKMKGIGNVLSIGVTAPLLLAGKTALQTASDLAEVQNVVDVAFGKSADTVNKWAKNLIDSHGMSELSAKRFAGTLGAMTKSMGLTDKQALDMSMSLTELTGDFASFYNLEHEEAFEKIRAGISGETEPLKQLGINMSVANLEAYALSKGIKKSYDSMTEAEKATLRYNYLMSVSADAQGDFARTSDSLANQTRKTKEEISALGADIAKEAIPVIKDILKQVSAWIKGFKNLSPETKQMILRIFAITAAAGPLIRVLGSVTSGVGSVVSGFKTLIGHAATAEKGATGLIGVFTKLTGATVATETAATGAAAATGATTTAMSAEATAATAASTATAGFGASLAAIALPAAAALAAAVAIGTAIDNATITTREFSDAMEQDFKDFADAVAGASGIMQMFVADTTASGEATESVHSKIAEVEAKIVETHQSYMNAKGEARKRDLADLRQYYADLAELMGQEITAYFKAQEVLKTKLKTGLVDVTKENVADVYKSIDDFLTQSTAAAEANRDAYIKTLDEKALGEEKFNALVNKYNDEHYKKEIATAQRIAAETAEIARQKLVANDEVFAKQLKSMDQFQGDIETSEKDFYKRLDEIRKGSYATEIERGQAVYFAWHEYQHEQQTIAQKIGDTWLDMDETTRTAWLNFINTQAQGGTKLDRDAQNIVDSLMAAYANMEGGLPNIGREAMIALGRAMLNTRDPQKAAQATDEECVQAFKDSYPEYQAAGAENAYEYAKGVGGAKQRNAAHNAGKDTAQAGKNGAGSVSYEQTGIDAILSYISGVRGQKRALWKVAIEVANHFIQGMLSKAGFFKGSPYRKMTAIAKEAIESFTGKIESETPKILRSGVDMARAVAEGAQKEAQKLKFVQGLGIDFTDQMCKVRQQIQANAALELGRVQISALNLNGAGGNSITYNNSYTYNSPVPMSMREMRQQELLTEQRQRLMGV